MADTTRKVVITGIGALTPLGIGAPLTFERLLKGDTGFRLIERWDTTDYATKFAAELRGVVYHAEEHFSKLEQRRLDPFSQVGIIAAREAWQDCGLSIEDMDPTRAGAILGTGIGGIQSVLDQHKVLQKSGPRRVTPFFISNTMSNALAANVAIELGLQGACFLTSSACASSGHAIGLAMREIRTGRADVMVTGGSETTTNDLCLAGFSSVKALSKRNDDPERSSRPFDRDRDGFVMGEGAGVLVLEELEHAKARGATIYCELAGFGQTDDAGHITAPDRTGQRPAAALKLAMEDGGLNPDEIDYINAHGTSTLLNDMVETMAIKKALGESAFQTAISSTKPLTGHLLGAASALEAVITVMAMHHNLLPPTINLTTPDPECDLDYVPLVARPAEVRVAMSNAFGFGGQNASVVFRK